MLILFLDESGCGNLDAIDPQYPILGIGGPIFNEDEYYATEDAKVKEFKRKFFGTDRVIMHTHDIRKHKGDFACLNNSQKCQEFIVGFAGLIDSLRFSFISRIIDPTGHRAKYHSPIPAYELVVGMIMESYVKILFRTHNTGKIYIERRGKKPDSRVRQAYDWTKEHGSFFMRADRFQRVLSEDIHFYDKKENSSGLQIADTTIGPVTASVLGGHYNRRDFCMIKNKFDKWYGLKRFPTDDRYWSFPEIPN